MTTHELCPHIKELSGGRLQCNAPRGPQGTIDAIILGGCGGRLQDACNALIERQAQVNDGKPDPKKGVRAGYASQGVVVRMSSEEKRKRKGVKRD